MFLLNILFAVFTLSLYFIPTMIAMSRRHVNMLPIFLLNLYLGFTILGWIAALIWAVSQTVPAAAGADVQPQAPDTPAKAKMKKYGKIGLAFLGGLVVLFLIAMFLTPSPAPVATSGQKAAAPVTSGVPVPASEAFGE